MFARSFAAALAACALMAVPASAQQQRAPAPLAQAAPVPQAAAPMPPADHVALARQVVELSGASSSFENVIPAFVEQASRCSCRPTPISDGSSTRSAIS